MQFLRNRVCTWALSSLVLALSACASDITAPIDMDPGTSEVPGMSWSLRFAEGGATAHDVWMGRNREWVSQVRVVDHRGNPVSGAAVRFATRWAGQTTAPTGMPDTVVLSGRDGLATLRNITFPVRDTVADTYVVSATLVADTLQMVTETFCAWRNVSQFGGNAPLVFATMPVALQQIGAILPLGTFTEANALPSADAILVPVEGTTPVVRAMADGLVTELNRELGAITLRVRDSIRVQMSGIELKPDLWVGAVLREGDALGTSRPVSPVTPGVAVRVLDVSVQRANWIRPERYGSRRHVAFFVKYLADVFRSNAYALVRRSAPDLSGTIDYDQVGKLVGTWFDPSAPAGIGSGTASTAATSPFLSTIQEQSEIDPTAALNALALTFAYDAQRPGQVRIAAGTGLGRRIGASGVRAVGWEDPDPAAVSAASGMVRYHLYDRSDSSRIGDSATTLLIQLLDNEHLRVEVVDGNVVAPAFSSRAVILIR